MHVINQRSWQATHIAVGGEKGRWQSSKKWLIFQRSSLFPLHLRVNVCLNLSSPPYQKILHFTQWVLSLTERRLLIQHGKQNKWRERIQSVRGRGLTADRQEKINWEPCSVAILPGITEFASQENSMTILISICRKLKGICHNKCPSCIMQSPPAPSSTLILLVLNGRAFNMIYIWLLHSIKCTR